MRIFNLTIKYYESSQIFFLCPPNFEKIHHVPSVCFFSLTVEWVPQLVSSASCEGEEVYPIEKAYTQNMVYFPLNQGFLIFPKNI